jgi:hypothetical protein
LAIFDLLTLEGTLGARKEKAQLWPNRLIMSGLYAA